MTAFFKKSKIPVSDLHSLNAFTVESLYRLKRSNLMLVYSDFISLP